MPNMRLTKAFISTLVPAPDRASRGLDTIFWDAALAGFGCKVTPKGSKSFIYQYRAPDGKSRRLTIGRTTKFSQDAARRLAEKAENSVRNGGDPMGNKKAERAADRLGTTIDDFLKACAGRVRRNQIAASTRDAYRWQLRHVKEDKLAAVRTKDITRRQLEALRDRLLEKPLPQRTSILSRQTVTGTLSIDTVNNTLRALSAMFGWARQQEIVNTNPAERLGQFQSTEVANYLTDDELSRLGSVLRQYENENPIAVAITRTALLTGMRRDEIVFLRWSEVDFEAGTITKAEYKSSRTAKTKRRGKHASGRVIAITDPARLVLELAEGWHLRGNEFVFPSQRQRSKAHTRKNGVLVELPKAPTGPYGGLKRFWDKVRVAAGIPHVRFHDLRHTVGSVAVSSGLGLKITGAILGHAKAGTTERYGHVNRTAQQRAAGGVAQAIASALDAGGGEVTSLNLPR
jgi:integrase